MTATDATQITLPTDNTPTPRARRFAEVLTALKTVKDKIARCRDMAKPGHYEGTVLVRLNYDYKVGEDYQARVTASIPWQAIAVAALNRLNTLSVQAAIDEAVKGKKDDEKTAPLRKVVEDRVRSLTDDSVRDCKGRVTGYCHIELADEGGAL